MESNQIDARVHVNCCAQAVLHDRSTIVVREVAENAHLEQMCRENCNDAMAKAGVNPFVACDVVPCLPHEETAQNPADSHGCNIMTNECLRLATCLHDQPQLRHDRHHAQVQPGHPERVEKWSRIHVCMEK